jgi:hypothetical protein
LGVPALLGGVLLSWRHAFSFLFGQYGHYLPVRIAAVANAVNGNGVFGFFEEDSVFAGAEAE